MVSAISVQFASNASDRIDLFHLVSLLSLHYSGRAAQTQAKLFARFAASLGVFCALSRSSLLCSRWNESFRHGKSANRLAFSPPQCYACTTEKLFLRHFRLCQTNSSLSACENAEKYPSLGLKKKGEGAPGGAQTKMGKSYDVMVIGPVSLDCNIDHLGNERREVGGAVVASGFAAAGSGAKTAIDR